MVISFLAKLAAPFRKNPATLNAALGRCRTRTPRIGTLIDVGASNGSWSLQARRFFPEMNCFMIEAQQEHEPSLEKLRKKDQRFDYVIAAAGDSDGDILFQEGDLFGGVATRGAPGAGYRQVPMVAVDSVVKSRCLSPPFMLKLDTHGFEVPILEGAQETLSQTELLIIETYNFQLTPECLRFHEICAYLEARGFRCVDMCDPLFRRDGVLWQMDLFFAPAGSSGLQTNSYF